MTTILKTIFKIALKVVSTTVVLLVIFFCFYWYNNRLFLFETRILWPQRSFDAPLFKTGNTSDRASMAADLIEKITLADAACKSIPETLGEPNGDYYHTESNYTYRLTDKETANWILTFVCNDHGKIAHVFIRKSCCSISQDILFWGLKSLQPLFIF